jgi:hypothetical protein
MSKKLAIVIVNWNSYDLTHDTLVSLSKTTYTNYDIILVDNCSEDGSGDKLKENFSNIILIHSAKNNGFTGGNNIGMQYALEHGYENVLLLNNDVAVAPNFIEPLIQKLASHKNTAAVQPLIYFHHNHELIWNAGSKYNSLLGIPRTPQYNKKDIGQQEIKKQKQIDWITGCAMMLKTEALKKVGLFRESFFIYYEDVDLSFRLKEAGYELAYEPSSVIYHIAGMSHKSKEKTKEGYISPKVHYLNARNRIWVLKQYTATLAIPFVVLYQIFYFFGIGFYFIFRRRWTKLEAWNKGIWDGLFMKSEA